MKHNITFEVVKENGKLPLYIVNKDTGERKHIGYINSIYAQEDFEEILENIQKK